MVRKELGYLPDDPLEMAFVSSVLSKSSETSQGNVEGMNKENKLKGLISKNK